MPRVTVKRLQPFETLASTARFVVHVVVAEPPAFAALAAMLAGHRGARGEIRASVCLPDGEATLLLGRDFLLDGELVARIEALPGVSEVRLAGSERHLALVG